MSFRVQPCVDCGDAPVRASRSWRRESGRCRRCLIALRGRLGEVEALRVGAQRVTVTFVRCEACGADKAPRCFPRNRANGERVQPCVACGGRDRCAVCGGVISATGGSRCWRCVEAGKAVTA